MRRLSIKQKKFIKAYVETGNGTQSALEVYNVKSPDVAKSIASENLSKPNIQEEIERIARKNNFSLEQNLLNIQNIANAKVETRLTADQILKANLEYLRLRGADRGKTSMHTNITLSKKLNDSNFNELIELHKQKSKEIEEILGD